MIQSNFNLITQLPKSTFLFAHWHATFLPSMHLRSLLYCLYTKLKHNISVAGNITDYLANQQKSNAKFASQT